MATSNSRDVTLKLLVDTIGQEGVDQLRAAIDALAKEGSSAAPELKKLTDQIDRLADQRDAVTTLQKLGDEAQNLAVRETAAATAVETLKKQLQGQRVVVEATSQAQLQANAAYLEAQKALNDTNGAIKLLRAEYDAAGKKTDDYKGKLRELLTTQVQQKNEIIEARVAQKEANGEATAAVRAQTALEAAQQRATQAAQQAANAVQAQQLALTEARDAATALGVSTDNLAQFEERLATEMRTVVAAAQVRVAAIKDMTEADRLLAIEEQGMIDLLRRGEAALQAEVVAQREAARAAEQYATAKERATASAADWQREAEGIVNAAEAAQRLSRETQVLATAQAELGRQRTFEQQAADAQKLLRAAEYVRFWETELQAAEVQARETAAAAEQAAQRISTAFSTVGVRSVEQLRLEIANTRTAMALLASQSATTGQSVTGAFTAGENRIKALEREIRELTGQLTLADQAADLFKNSIGQIAAGNVIADGIGYLVNKVKEMGREFIDVIVQTERLRKGLQAVYKDSAVAAQQFDFLRTAANNAGFSISTSSDAFLRFSAATKSANLPLNVTNELFLAVTRAGTTLGLTAEGVTGTLDALGQMASKGVVSMEELRQQLGDRLPGALSLAAKGLGITDQQLIKLVESGQLATRDFFPAFTAGLKTLAGDTDSLTSNWARFTNMLTEFSRLVGDAGGLQVLQGALRALAVVVGVVLVPLQGFVEVMNLIGQGLGRLLAALTTGNFKAAFEGFGTEVEKAGARIQTLHNAIEVAVNGTESQTKALQTNNIALAQGSSGVLSMVAAQERLAAGTAATGSAFVQQIVRLQENATAIDAAITSSEKLLKAKQDEGKALVLTANLTGDASKALIANAQASTANVAASEQVVAARTREVSVTTQAIALIERERDSQGKLTSDRQAALDKLKATLLVQDAELEKSRQTTFELGRQALAAQAASEAYADNSTKVAAYQTAMQNAAETAKLLTEQVARQAIEVDRLALGHRAGKISLDEYNAGKANLELLTNQLNKATGEAAKMENLYRDAVKDSVNAINLRARADAANLGVSEALAKAQQAHYETLARQAKALGDEAAATYYTIEAKQRQIQAIRLAIEIKNLELDADKAGIEVQIAALDPQDKLYEQKKKELEIRLQVIKAKQIEANASKETIKGIEDEITAIRNLQNAKGGSVTTINAGQNPQEAPKDSFGQPDKTAKPGTSGSSGSGTTAGKPPADTKSPFSFSAGGDLQTRTGVANFLRNAGVTNDADIKRIVAEFSDGKGNIPYINNPGQKKYADGGTISQALLKAAESVTFDKKGTAAPKATTSTGAGADPRNAVPDTGAGSAAPAASAPVAPGAATRTINVNIGNKPYSFQVANDASSDTVTAMLRELETKAGTAQ